MPSYDLTCRSCGLRFEKFVMRMLRNEDLVCPSCGSIDVKRGIGGGVLATGTRSGTESGVMRSRTDRLSLVTAEA